MIEFRTACPEDTFKQEQLWLTCFSDKEKAVKLFFNRNMHYMHGYLAFEGDDLISAVYLIDCKLCGKAAHYLCGAATLPEYRNRGIMSELIDFALKDAEKRGDKYSVLLPADDGLYRFYSKLGYYEGCASCRREFKSELSDLKVGCEEPDYQLLQNCNADKFLFWNNDYIKFAGEYYACYGVKTLKNKHVFAFFEQDGDSAEVFYAIYNSLSELKSLLFNEGIKRFRLTGSASNPIFSDIEPRRHGMIKALGGSEKINNVFIGISLE